MNGRQALNTRPIYWITPTDEIGNEFLGSGLNVSHESNIVEDIAGWHLPRRTHRLGEFHLQSKTKLREGQIKARVFIWTHVVVVFSFYFSNRDGMDGTAHGDSRSRSLKGVHRV